MALKSLLAQRRMSVYIISNVGARRPITALRCELTMRGDGGIAKNKNIMDFHKYFNHNDPEQSLAATSA